MNTLTTQQRQRVQRFLEFVNKLPLTTDQKMQFTENYVKVKTAWDPGLVNTIHRIKLSSIDEDGMVRFEWVEKRVKEEV